jgi:hypothetical protein
MASVDAPFAEERGRETFFFHQKEERKKKEKDSFV